MGSLISSVYLQIVETALRIWTSRQVGRGSRGMSSSTSSPPFMSICSHVLRLHRHSSSTDEMVSLRDSFTFNLSLRSFICFEILLRPFLRISRGFGAMVVFFLK